MKSVKIINFHSDRPPAVHASVAAAAFAAVILSSIARAADVTLNTADARDSSSFGAAGGWSNAAAPSAGNDYIVPILRLRTPADAVEHTFAGNSLKITTTNGNLTFKGTGNPVITVNNLILDGGLIDHLNGAGDVFNLAGNLKITGTGSRIAATQGPINVAAAVSGTGDLAIINNLVTTFSGTNTYTGTLTLSGAFVLAPAGSLTFKIGATGVNNQVTGTGAGAFNGAFNIDLSTAGDTVGNTWTLVNAATVVETFGASFNIPGFTENENIWTSGDGKYQFLESTGVLSRINSDTDGDGLPDAWEMQYFNNLDETATLDPDGDLATNLLEYQSGTNPDNADSYPDTDNDLLGDGWEMRYFNGSLAQTGAGDPDGDYNTNAVEFAAGSDPSSAFSYPDTDSDNINDGWEIHYFGSITACDPDADADGDLYSNFDEFVAIPGTDPKVQISSPDTDPNGPDKAPGDGLADGWEVKYFRVGTEDLASVIARQNGAGDPDGDHLSNIIELKGGTDPTNAASGDLTLGYWRFEELLTGEVPAGGNGAYAFPTSVTDSSVYGNPMMAWADYVRPNYDTVIPATTVPATGASNTASLFFLRNNSGIYYMESVFTTPADRLPAGQGSLRTITLDEFTVEASFNTPLTGVWQVPVCKVGNPVGGQPPFSMKIDTTNKLRAGIVDGSGVAREIIGTSTIAAGSWYSAAVTATATQMTLWVKKPGDSGYSSEGTIAISGAWYVPAGGPLNTAWQVGAGVWNNVAADPFQGNIDEVRISAVALAPEKFLFYTVGSPYSTWAEANIPDTTKRGEADDADGDGASNLTEYRLGLAPNSGASRFTVTRAADGTMSWPSAVGVKFDVQRSTTLAAGSWVIISPAAGIDGTAGTASFTDTASPAAGAFYRILLRP